MEERGARPARFRRGLRWGLALLVAVLVLGETSIAFAVTRDVRAVRTSNGWRWRDASGDSHTYIEPGDYIRWRNPTNRTHNVVAYDAGADWNYSRTLAPGTSVRRQFNRRGNFYYRCTIHSALSNGVCSGQCGIIHV
jgi:plastocyanin